MKLGIYVGSFNPPHNGHFKVVNYLLDNKIVDKIIILPTSNYWDKSNMVDIDKRVEMLKIFESENVIVDGINNRYPHTYQILNNLKKYYPDDELYLIIGSDNLEKFHLWKNIEEILKYHIIVLKRGNTDIYKYLSKFDTSKFLIIENFPSINVPSTEIRSNLDNENLDARVLKYIKKHKLYGS